MAKSKVSIALFVVLLTFSGFYIGMLLARFFIPKGVGLAGGAMVLGYGLLGFILALIAGLIVHRYMTGSALKWTNLLLGIFILAMTAWLINKFNSRDKQESSINLPPTEVPVTKAPVKWQELRAGQDISIGFAKPKMEAGEILYLYQKPQPGPPKDSLHFVNNRNGVDLKNNPLWLRPEVFKLDYQLFYFQVRAERGDFYQVVLHRDTKEKAWIHKAAVAFLDWPAFLLSMHSVEPKNRADNLVRLQPENHAEPLPAISRDFIFQPIKTQGDWIQIEIFDLEYEKVGTGWIRWKENSNLLLDYNLLS